jgi:hypothetical protein
MTDAEVATLIADHYRGEAQTLSQAAEANLLKWREINSLSTEEDVTRWTAIKSTFKRNILTGGAGENDPINRITGHMNAFTIGLEKIEQAVSNPTLSEITVERLTKIIEGLRAVPVNVEINVQPVESQASSSLPVAITNNISQPVDPPGESPQRNDRG